MTNRIAFQGEPGAYSHQACRNARPDMEALPCRTFEDAIDAWRHHASRFADANDGVILAATAGAIGVRLGGASLRPWVTEADGQPVPSPGAVGGEGWPGAAARPSHFTQVVGLVWRTVALWLLLLVLLTLAHVLG